MDVKPVARRRWLRLFLLLLLLAATVTAAWLVVVRAPNNRPSVMAAEASDVRSTVTRRGDSLEVAVSWVFTVDSARSVPESVRVEVGLGDGQVTSVSTEPAERRSDTLLVSAPGAGETASGYSCVAPILRGRIRGESCTPWQFVVPRADTVPARRDTVTAPAEPRPEVATRAPTVARIVVQPAGLQVDPDRDGRCARWQRQNPGRSVWLEVNRRAVPECTGPNGKPTVAQFCAFAVLEDGRRVKTENAFNNEYCDRLFQEWAGERVS